MITANSQVVNVAPDIKEDGFVAILLSKSNLTEKDARDSYRAVIAEHISPLFCLAVFSHESNFGRLGICHDFNTKSPGNTRSSVTLKGSAITTPKGTYIRYPSWALGFEDLATRLRAPEYIYGRKGLVTIAQIMPIFAPVSDGNNPDIYIKKVVQLMSEWIGSSEVTPVAAKPNITWRGSPNFWVGRHSEDVIAIVDHIMQSSIESADGWFKNRTSEVSAHFGVAKDGRIWQWVSLSDAAWANGIPESPDMTIPWLSEAINNGWNPNNRTVSIEHEGNTGEAMPETQYQATLALHRWLMSQFPAILPDRKHVIGHYQISAKSRPNCPGTGFPWQRLMADLVLDKVYGGGITVTQNNPDMITLNGHILGGGFKIYYDKFGGARFFGLPITDEYTNPQTGLTEQVFERYALEFNPKETNPDWQVRGKIVGPAYLANRGF